jgi:hypothetical protein
MHGMNIKLKVDTSVLTQKIFYSIIFFDAIFSSYSQPLRTLNVNIHSDRTRGTYRHIPYPSIQPTSRKLHNLLYEAEEFRKSVALQQVGSLLNKY